jgi:DNA-binding MarR family transcriptional regulator
LAELRYCIRQFLHIREMAARDAGIAPQQYLLLLQVKGLEDSGRATIGVLAERLQLRHHTTVELVDRMVSRRLIARQRAGREVVIVLRPAGDAILKKLAQHSVTELQTEGPALVRALTRLIKTQRPSTVGDSSRLT